MLTAARSLLWFGMGTVTAIAIATAACSTTIQGVPFDRADGGSDAASTIDSGTRTETTNSADAGPGGRAKRVFVTSTRYTGNLGGPEGADEICEAAAAKADLGGTWHAWISGGGVDAIDHIVGPGPWYLVDGTTLIFGSKTAIPAGPSHPIDADEYGRTIVEDVGFLSTSVWTATEKTGRRTSSGFDCKRWSTTDDFEKGLIGFVTNTDQWSSATTAECSEQLRLYCFEQ